MTEECSSEELQRDRSDAGGEFVEVSFNFGELEPGLHGPRLLAKEWLLVVCAWWLICCQRLIEFAHAYTTHAAIVTSAFSILENSRGKAAQVACQAE